MIIDKLNSSLKRRKIFGEVWSMEEKKNRKGKGGKYLEKENIWSAEEQKWRRKNRKYLGREEEKRIMKGGKIFVEEKYLVIRGKEQPRQKYLQIDNIVSGEEIQKREEKGGKFLAKESTYMVSRGEEGVGKGGNI